MFIHVFHFSNNFVDYDDEMGKGGEKWEKAKQRTKKVTNRRTKTKARNKKCKGRRPHCTTKRSTEQNEKKNYKRRNRRERNEELGEKKNQRKRTAKLQETKESQKGRSLTCLPRREHSHHPSMPPVFCSSTVRTSPFLKASSSGDSAMLSYKARATQFCNTQTRIPVQQEVSRSVHAIRI